jgi:hypothetical protein
MRRPIEMLPECLGASTVVKVGFDDDNPGPITFMAKVGETASLAVKPLAHRAKGISKIGLLNRHLNVHARNAPFASIRRERSLLSVTGAKGRTVMLYP